MIIDLTKIQSYFINLDSDSRKKQDLEDWHEKLGFVKPIRVPGIVHEHYWFGLSQAHINAIELGLAGNSSFLLFEDDATPMENFYKNIEIPDDADAVYLGFSNWGYSPDGNPPQRPGLGKVIQAPGPLEAYRAKNILVTHAILHINPEFSKSFIKSCQNPSLNLNLDVKLVADGIFDKHNVYAIGPLFYQNEVHKPLMSDATKNVNVKDLL